ncbi:flagellar biosynthesis protein FlhB [Leptothrix discophora]|uniref:Flagellar biosynthetic protein FlhB n=1 Tax=Leptothrix discophora TaxID=89 RepID=A0ABT9G4Z8_LEPDI|nr:flagellar biosynthesis protein FlhB [Leptothrix discophora]MDP4301565.1 flagellar biosynthesis protein FlhB [Leptothrix discophora]
MADSAQEKQLPPTERRLKQAREDGQVARSRDLGHFAVIAGGLGLVLMAAPSVTQWLRDLMGAGLRFDVHAVTEPRLMQERLGQLIAPALLIGLGLGIVTGLVALAAAVISGGWNFTLKPLAPKFSKLNPLAGLGRIVSKQQIVETLKACLLALLLGAIGAAYLWNHLGDFALTQSMPLPAAFAAAGDRIASGLWLLLIVLALFAAVDVPLQRFMHTSQLKMSLQEIKEEHKQQEGSPELKGRLRQRMREASRRRMLAAVPSADLVVMNPTHYAVALKYEDGKQSAPRVVAKGADLLAMKIRDVAREAKVPVLQAPPLARALYAHGEIDREIPYALYSAVAQVLAHVFQLRAALAGRAPWPADLPAIPVPPELDPHNVKTAQA